ncbi:MAG: spondin domain-containing protein [Candidatus Eisenbacteria bacterium]
MNRLAIALGLTGLAFAGAASAATYTITVEDLVPGGPATGQPLSPPVAAVHDGSYSLFAEGAAASPGLEIVARDGTPTTLLMEAEAASGVSYATIGSAGPFFDSVQFTVEGEAGDLFSVAMMLGRTNDLITGVHDIVLPSSDTVVLMTNAYDAGVEVNTGMIEHIPFYGNSGVGPDEDGVITMIGSYTIFNDPDFGKLDFTFPPAARITIEPGNTTPVETTTWGAIKGLYAR